MSAINSKDISVKDFSDEEGKIEHDTKLPGVSDKGNTDLEQDDLNHSEVKNSSEEVDCGAKESNDKGKLEDEDEDEDSDFGSFDEASFSDFEESEMKTKDEGREETPELEHTNEIRFTEEVIADETTFNEKLKDIVDKMFPLTINDKDTLKETNDILSDRSSEIYGRLGALPHLNPPNWTRSKIRHNLLIQLGLPVNLDEFSNDTQKHSSDNVPSSAHKPKGTDSIDWKQMKIPLLADLNISSEETKVYLQKTNDILAKVETENLNNTSENYLLAIEDESVLDIKLNSMQKNHDDLIKLASIWNNQLEELMEDFNTFEEVVQNYVGYSQKLRRNELVEKMKKMKQKSKKSKVAFWK